MWGTRRGGAGRGEAGLQAGRTLGDSIWSLESLAEVQLVGVCEDGESKSPAVPSLGILQFPFASCEGS